MKTFEISPKRREELEAMPYEDYLKTPEWYRRRNRALSLAGWACMRCPNQRTLEVHHKSYERIGAELDSDLEVLCARCHEGIHLADQQDRHPGVFVKLVSDALAQGKFKSMADLVEAVKLRCAREHIPYDSAKIWRAAGLVDANRHGVVDAPRAPAYSPPQADVLAEPIGREEAQQLCRNILQRFNAKILVRRMPRADLITQREADRIRAMAMVEQEMLDSLKRCEELERQVESEPKADE